MATFVLVHGAFYGGYVWRRVAARLRAGGHEVFTPTLTGLGERAHLLSREVGLDTHIEDVASVLAYEDLTSVILVGQSYGGMVIGGVAERAPERIGHLVFLDAHIPEDGKCDMEILGSDTKAALDGLGGEGWQLPLISAEVTGVTDPADLAWLTPRRRPHPLKTMLDPIRLTRPEAARIPRSYIACTRPESLTALFGGNPLERFWRRARAEGWPFWEIATGHDAMVTAPGALSEVLGAIALGKRADGS